MDPKDKINLEQILRLSEENNKMIHKLYKSWWWSRVWSWVYWAVIIGVAFGLLYFLQPYIDKIKDTYSDVRSQLEVITPRN